MFSVENGKIGNPLTRMLQNLHIWCESREYRVPLTKLELGIGFEPWRMSILVARNIFKYPSLALRIRNTRRPAFLVFERSCVDVKIVFDLFPHRIVEFSQERIILIFKMILLLMLLSLSLRRKHMDTIRAADRAVDIKLVAFEFILIPEFVLAATTLQWVDLFDLFGVNVLHMLPEFD